MLAEFMLLSRESMLLSVPMPPRRVSSGTAGSRVASGGMRMTRVECALRVPWRGAVPNTGPRRTAWRGSPEKRSF